jgi:hypothetical protein
MLEAGHPNLTLMECASVCIPMVATYNGSMEIVGLHRLNQITTDGVIEGIKNIMSDYLPTIIEMSKVREKYDWKNVCKQLNKNYEAVSKFHHKNSDAIRTIYRDIYSNTTKL